MILTLEVIGAQAEDLGPRSRKVFDRIGGTIGRLPDNDWVFADPHVSGRHALIRYLNGKFFVEDASTNGVFINSRDNRLPRGEPRRLKSGDLIFIDAYQIRVSIEKPSVANSRVDDPFAMLGRPGRNGGDLPGVGARCPSADERTVKMVRITEETSIEWFGMTEVDDAPEPRNPASLSPQAAAHDAPLGGSTTSPSRQATIEFTGSGSDPSGEKLLRQVLVSASDLHDHAALVAAMRIAFESMLARFDPLHLEQEFDAQTRKGSTPGAPSRPSRWELYRDRYAALAKDTDASFQSLFGEAFANAYGQHSKRLHAVDRNRRK